MPGRQMSLRLLATAWLFAISSVFAQEKPEKPYTPELAREELAYTVGVQAYIYGYPLVEMYRVRHFRIGNTTRQPRGHLNQFEHMRELQTHTSVAVICPNNDTLYSSAFFNLATEPLVLELPDTNGRYYVAHFMDFYTNGFAYLGKRTTGTKAGTYLLTGPGWKGTLPANMKRIESPTNAGWLLARILIDGPEELAAVHALQDQFHLTPLSRWGRKELLPPQKEPEYPAFETATDRLKYFEFLNLALHENPPRPEDRGLLSLFSQIGISREKPFAVKDLDAATARGLRRAWDTGEKIVFSLKGQEQPLANGWTRPRSHLGQFGDDYLYRAHIAKHLLAAMSPEEASIFTLGLDTSVPLKGENRYRLRFEKGELPPVEAFWSVTMYHSPSGFLVENPKQRYSVGDRTKGLKYGPDGSLEMTLQRESPGPEKESNWLPAPKGNFGLALRCYVPKAAILSGAWKPPAVMPVP
jgi:hypothetical protein